MDIKFNMIRLAFSAKSQPNNEKFRTSYARMRAEQANADAADTRCARHDLVSRVVPAMSEACHDGEDSGGGGGVGGGGGGGGG